RREDGLLARAVDDHEGDHQTDHRQDRDRRYPPQPARRIWAFRRRRLRRFPWGVLRAVLAGCVRVVAVGRQALGGRWHIWWLVGGTVGGLARVCRIGVSGVAVAARLGGGGPRGAWGSGHSRLRAAGSLCSSVNGF